MAFYFHIPLYFMFEFSNFPFSVIVLRAHWLSISVVEGCRSYNVWGSTECRGFSRELWIPYITTTTLWSVGLRHIALLGVPIQPRHHLNLSCFSPLSSLLSVQFPTHLLFCSSRFHFFPYLLTHASEAKLLLEN